MVRVMKYCKPKLVAELLITQSNKKFSNSTGYDWRITYLSEVFWHRSGTEIVTTNCI